MCICAYCLLARPEYPVRAQAMLVVEHPPRGSRGNKHNGQGSSRREDSETERQVTEVVEHKRFYRAREHRILQHKGDLQEHDDAP